MTLIIVLEGTHLTFCITYAVLPAHHSKLVCSSGLWWHDCHVFDHSIAQIHSEGQSCRKRQLGEHLYSLLTNCAAKNCRAETDQNNKGVSKYVQGTPSARQNKVLTSLWNHLFLPHTSLCHLVAFTELLKNHQAAAAACSIETPRYSAGTRTKQFLTTVGCIEVSAVLQCIIQYCTSYSIAHSMALVQVPCCMKKQHGQRAQSGRMEVLCVNTGCRSRSTHAQVS